MRVPTVLTKCKIASGLAIGLIAAGSLSEHVPWLRAWGLLVAVYAVALFLGAAVEAAAETVQAYVKKWAHQSFEDGFKGGVDVGREMEAARQFIAATTPERH